MLWLTIVTKVLSTVPSPFLRQIVLTVVSRVMSAGCHQHEQIGPKRKVWNVKERRETPSTGGFVSFPKGKFHVNADYDLEFL